ncbi:MAG: hypothetical protein FJ271_28425 [Planctomycetes bacterium]|nr:hypothetical protein [Planctomycetota bacterium]
MRCAGFKAVAAFLLLLVCPLDLVRADENAAALEKVRAAHAATWKSIRSLSCEVQITHSHLGRPVKVAPVRVKYWQRGESDGKSETIRCIEESDSRKLDIFIDGPVQWEFYRYLGKASAGQKPGGSIELRQDRLSPGASRFGYDPWELALFRFGREHLSFDEFLVEPRERVRLKLHPTIDLQLQLRSVDIAELIHIGFSRTQSLNKDFVPIDPTIVTASLRETVEFWFDPRVNYLIRKHLIRGLNAKEHAKNAAKRHQGPFSFSGEIVRTVTRFIEHQPGIFFPEAVKTERPHKKGEVTLSSLAVFSNVKINEPIPDEAFRFRFPPGILVTDHVTKKFGMTDAAGELTLPPRDDKGVIATRPGLKSVGAIEPPAPQPREEPMVWLRWWWLFPVLVALLVVGRFLMELCGGWLCKTRPRQDLPNSSEHREG